MLLSSEISSWHNFFCHSILKQFSDKQLYDPVSSQKGRTHVGEGPERDSPSHSHSNRHFFRGHNSRRNSSSTTSGSTCALGGSTHVCTSVLPAGIYGSTDCEDIYHQGPSRYTLRGAHTHRPPFVCIWSAHGLDYACVLVRRNISEPARTWPCSIKI